MATIFRRKRSDIYIANVKLWNAVTGQWEWKKQSTGTSDEAAAAGIAATLESASHMAKAGRMTRAKAMSMVNDVLRLAGVDEIKPIPSVREIMKDLIASKSVSEGTDRKYSAMKDAFELWGGSALDKPVDSWTVDDLSPYYTHLQGVFATTTANDHLTFVSMVFGSAEKRGHRLDNPVEAIPRLENDGMPKIPLKRPDVAGVYRAIRRAGRKDWVALAALGWHTGHRIQDLLNVDPAKHLKKDKKGWLLSIWPLKKGKKVREVILPIPTWLALLLKKLGGFKTIHHGNNRNGRVSADFHGWLVKAGIDTQPVKRGKRTVNMICFHSFRHSMSFRLASAGISGELSRLVTDHSSPKVHRGYVHSEIQGLREALAAIRGR